jgi:hypothetical protein
MKKIKAIIILGVIVVFMLVGRWYLLKTSQPKVYKNLSDRAKEYINKQSKQQNTKWSNIDLENKKGVGPQVYDIGNCANVIIPYPILYDKIKETCYRMFTINRPNGKIIVNIIGTDQTDIDLIPAVRSRQLNSNYVTSSKKINGYTYRILTNKTHGVYEKYAFLILNKRFLAFAFIFNTTNNMDKTFFNVLKSIKYKETV